MMPYVYGGVVHVAKIGVYSNEEWKMRYHESFIMFLKLLHLLYNDCLIYTLKCVSLQPSLPRKHLASLRMSSHNNNLLGYP